MLNEAEFQELLEKVRAGDEEAATILVDCFEPLLHRQARLHLTDPLLREVVDSLDICQSVMRNFFARVTEGEFHLEHPNQLIRLLAVMAKNKVINHARSGWRRQKSGTNNLDSQSLDQLSYLDFEPSRHAAARELIRLAEQSLSEEEQKVVELRFAGWTWTEIAEQMGGKPDTIRRRHARVIERLSRRLGTTLLNDEK